MSVLDAVEDLTVLSPYYSMPTYEQLALNNEEELDKIENLKSENKHILTNEYGSVFLINSTIKAFLDAFRSPKSLSEVIDNFAKMAGCKPIEIEPTMQSFYKSMTKHGILVDKRDADIITMMSQEAPLDNTYFKVGDEINQYKIESELTRKKPSELYLVRSSEHKESMVLKILIFPESLPQKVKNRALRKFEQEFTIMEEISSHPNVCKLIDLNLTYDHPYAVIEYIKGESLRRWVKQPNLTITRKINIITQMLSSIAHVQNEGIIHGDIHLGNFMIDNDDHLKLIDFGFSNRTNRLDGEIRRNGGVSECIPPERVDPDAFGFLSKNPDCRSEVFQLGVMIFYILYHHYPFSGFTWNEMVDEILNKELAYLKLSEDGFQIPDYVLDTLQISMQKDPNLRFRDAHEMLTHFVK